jgi:hypothetical protein
MAFDLYSTAALLGVVRVTPIETSYWLDQFFQRQITFESEQIMFDRIETNRRLAPFVSPVVQGRVMRSQGYETRAFRPAYSKPKHVVDPNRVFARLAGEDLGGSSTPAQRWNAAVVENMAEERRALQRLFNWMGAMAVIHGKVTITGEDYPTQVVDFGRDPGLTRVLAATARWGEADAKPLDDIRELRTLAFQKSGAPINRLTMGIEAFDRFFADQAVKDLLKGDMRVTTSDSQLSALGSTDTPYEYRGVLQGANGQGRIEIYTYNEQYEDKDGNTVDYMSPLDVVGTGGSIQGVRCFGAIRDKRAGLMAMPIFPKMWDQEDPSVTYTMSQSAPLMVPANTNNSFRIVASDGL